MLKARSLILIITGAVLTGMLCSVALAEDMDELNSAAESTAAAYDAAVAERDRIAGQVEELEGRIAEKEAEIPVLQQRASEAIVGLYKIGSDRDALIEMFLDSNSLEEILYNWNSYEALISHYNTCMKQNADARVSLEADRIKLDQDRAAAQVAVDEAESAMEAAEAARTAAQAQAAARASSAADAARAAEINWNMTKEEFVAEWGSRIDAYLSGTPLSGYGTTFADAAWSTGADPRFSVSISRIESGCGAACFASYNPFGWLSRSFSSWEEAIYAHASYICGSIYNTNGYLTRSFASTYCPPTADSWYNKVSNEMAKI